MRNVLIYLLLTVFVLPTYSQENEQLTREQKIKDFEYLYNTFKENYPYFGVAKRKHGIDWLAKKDEYLALIADTPNDSSYIKTLEVILYDIRNGHTDLAPTSYWEEFGKLYNAGALERPMYTTWVDMMEDPVARPQYWSILLNGTTDRLELFSSGNKEANYSDTIMKDKGIAIMKINSFNKFDIEKDKPQIDSFLSQIENCRYLIIDIQKNEGGSTDYWKNNIVRYLTKDTIVYAPYALIKGGELNRRFYGQDMEGAIPVQRTDQLVNIPEELLDGTFLMKTRPDTIIPVNPISFNGDIYLLTSRRVYSSAEGFAHFCKTTGWATVAGERTAGDGVGSDPIIFVLPESGILLRCPALTGFNMDGSLNVEERTTPDIPIKADSFDERLDKLIEYLSI